MHVLTEKVNEFYLFKTTNFFYIFTFRFNLNNINQVNKNKIKNITNCYKDLQLINSFFFFIHKTIKYKLSKNDYLFIIKY